MSVPSHKSNRIKVRNVHLPQRANGRARVAAIVEAAAIVFEEKGYDNATMAEIAARSDTKIGSLYRFFPNKQSLADTIIVSTREKFDAEFDQFDVGVASLSVSALADGLIALVLNRLNKSAAKKLLDVDRDWSVKLEEFRLALLRRIANALMIHTPGLSKKLAEDVAQVIVFNVKSMASYKASFDSGAHSSPKSSAESSAETSTEHEFRDMIRLYLQSRLSPASSKSKNID
jgi:AcrR family transcriptional regulator